MATPPDVIADLRAKWNSFASSYTQTFDTHVSIQSARELHRHLNLDSATTVLEVGAGAGLGSLDALGYLQESGLGVKYTLTDLSPSMLDFAKKNIPPSRYSFPLDFVEANSQELQFQDASFDRYISTLVLQLVPDADAMLRECHRVLLPGGLAGFVIWGRPENTPFFQLMAAANEKLGAPSGFTSNYALGSDLSVLQAKIHAAGFAAATAWPYVSVVEKWDAGKYATLVGRLFPVEDKDVHAKRHAILVDLASAWLAKGQPIVMETYLIVAKK
ncbi:hypothetical protein DYB32_002201 [Aphanomyces invadans]|uniref:Methyltransferase type 11 domain-containing protein n=1 Tax=Aphanomyces invadans TaxID=157072 RepID=A0A3R6Z3J0_9STRA|nr:hypothetical protein DYB32_002201 [Aphanomyces invadans]